MKGFEELNEQMDMNNLPTLGNIGNEMVLPEPLVRRSEDDIQIDVKNLHTLDEIKNVDENDFSKPLIPKYDGTRKPISLTKPSILADIDNDFETESEAGFHKPDTKNYNNTRKPISLAKPSILEEIDSDSDFYRPEFKKYNDYYKQMDINMLPTLEAMGDDDELPEVFASETRAPTTILKYPGYEDDGIDAATLYSSWQESGRKMAQIIAILIFVLSGIGLISAMIVGSITDLIPIIVRCVAAVLYMKGHENARKFMIVLSIFTLALSVITLLSMIVVGGLRYGELMWAQMVIIMLAQVFNAVLYGIIAVISVYSEKIKAFMG